MISHLRVVLFLILFFITATVRAEPCTLYKPADIARARENLARYQWAQQIVDSWQRSVHFVMEQDRGFIEEMISELTPWPTYGQNCPACVGKKSSMGECGIYNWTVAQPDKLICKYCGTEYPNPKYPETGELVCPKMGQVFTYYETPEEKAHPEDKSGKYAFRWVKWPVHTSFSGIIRSYKAGYVIHKVLPLAKLYAVTGEVKYAQRAAWILDRLARVYPQYLFHSYNGTYADMPPAEVAQELGRNPRGGKFPKEVIINAFDLHQKKDHAELCNGFWGSGRYKSSGGDGSIILDMTVGYDLIRTARYPEGEPVLTSEIDRRIVKNLLLAGCEDSENWNEINNKCGPGRALSAAAGILFERPKSVRRGLEGFQLLLNSCYHFDGFCRESPTYSRMHLSHMHDIPNILQSYSDPLSCQSRQDERIENLDTFKDIDRYRLALESMVRMLAPGRQYPVIGDSHDGSGLDALWVEILADHYGEQYAGLLEEVQGCKLEEAGNEYALWHRNPEMTAQSDNRLPLHTEWFPGWHVGVLRGGKPEGDTALYLNGNARHSHRHADTLGIIYYAYGKELACDQGYIWDDPRNAWTSSTLAHNIVTVDGGNQDAPDRHSRLELFGACPGLEVVQASANAYQKCERYQRTCVLVQLPGEQSYAVDFFRVTGGKLHQYCFHCNGKLTKLSTSEPQPSDEEIRWLSNLRTVTPKGPFTATWEYAGLGLDLIMLSRAQRLIVADAPGWRSDAGSELDAPAIQQVIAERKDVGPSTSSQYVALIVPYSLGSLPVLSARIIHSDLKSNTVAVEVKLPDRTDIIISTLDQKERQYDSVRLKGEFGFVSLDSEGKVQQAYLLGGTGLKIGELEIRLPSPNIPLKVKSVSNRTFYLEKDLPHKLDVEGFYLLAGETGYEIQSTGKNFVAVRDYPGITCDEIKILNSVYWQLPLSKPK